MTKTQRHQQLRRRLLKATALSPWWLAACEQAEPDDEADTNYLAPKKVYCSLPQNTSEGVYYRPNAPLRNDLRDDSTGALLHLKFKVVDVNKKCFPVAYANVDIWHADGRGIYSNADPVTGMATGTGQFCRGSQNTTPFGKAQFITSFPAWSVEMVSGTLKARTSHIMIKVHLNNKTLLTSQCYFADEIVEHVHSLVTYQQRQQQSLKVQGQRMSFKRPLKNADDPLWLAGADENLVMKTKPISMGYEAEILIGVAV